MVRSSILAPTHETSTAARKKAAIGNGDIEVAGRAGEIKNVDGNSGFCTTPQTHL
jgi:hypothetical protein